MRNCSIVGLLLSLTSLSITAQTPKPRPIAKPKATKIKTGQNSNYQEPESKSKPDFLGGEVTVSFDTNPNLVKLGLVENGVLVIEFPESDSFFRWHGGNSNMVYIDDSPTKRTDHFIVLRPAPPSKENPKGFDSPVAISIQMSSGLVVPFLIYPTSDTAKSAYRCILRYDRDKVIASRHAVGLATNLRDADESKPVDNKVVAQAVEEKITTEAAKAPENPKQNLVPISLEIDSRAKKGSANGSAADDLLKRALANSIKDPKRFKNWTPPVHGLSLSSQQPVQLDEHFRLVVVAARNVTADPIRILSDHPEISVETLDDKKKPLQVEELKKVRSETTSLNNTIPAGTTVYYALLFESPILGAKQHLKVSIGQINAADEPAATDLTRNSR
ncbi:MAG TPA: hypothetical protein VFC63_04205 [Blastocatellia bacterium]|nr:hypothetical protein [Blastocatellia bacterium]